jgi:hypothetical protein
VRHDWRVIVTEALTCAFAVGLPGFEPGTFGPPAAAKAFAVCKLVQLRSAGLDFRRDIRSLRPPNPTGFTAILSRSLAARPRLRVRDRTLRDVARRDLIDGLTAVDSNNDDAGAWRDRLREWAPDRCPPRPPRVTLSDS